MNRRRTLWLLGTALGLCVLAPAVGAERAPSGFKVVVHADNPTTSLSARDVSSFLLKKKTKWADGVPVEPVDQEDGTRVRQAFSEAVHGRSVASIKSFWQRQIFSGDAVPPPELDGDSAVVSFVQKNRGAIGYVAASTRLPGSVKVLAVASE